MACEETKLILHGLGGELCTIAARPDWAVHEVKAAVEAEIQVQPRQQRLLLGTRELRDADRLSDLGLGDVEHVTLIKRPAQQVEWLAHVEKDWSKLLGAPAAAWEDADVVLAAVGQCGTALQHAAEALRADRRVVLAAVRQSGLALQHAAPALAGDREVALEAAAECGRALDFASEALQRDRDFVLEAAQRNGRVLEHALPAFRTDREVVLAAVTNCGPALASASADLRADYEIVSAAVEQDPGAVIFASSKLRAEFDIQQRQASPEAADDTESMAFFSARKTAGNLGMSSVLGLEAALMCEIGSLGLPVVPGFCFAASKAAERRPDLSDGPIKQGLASLEAATELQFGNVDAPLLLSVHADIEAAVSLGDLSVSNIGLNDEIVSKLSERWHPRCVLDCYRRFIYSFASVAKGLDMRPFDEATASVVARLDSKCQLGRKHEVCDIPRHDLQDLVDEYRLLYEEQTGVPFPQDPKEQLCEALAAVLGGDAHEDGEEARVSRAVIQAAALGNFDSESAVGVVSSTQSAKSHLAEMSGEWLQNAQFEDISMGTRLGLKLTIEESRMWAAQNGVSEEERRLQYPSMEEKMPAAFAKMMQHQSTIAAHFPQVEEAHNMVYIVQQGRLSIARPSPSRRPSLTPTSPSCLQGRLPSADFSTVSTESGMDTDADGPQEELGAQDGAHEPELPSTPAAAGPHVGNDTEFDAEVEAKTGDRHVSEDCSVAQPCARTAAQELPLRPEAHASAEQAEAPTSALAMHPIVELLGETPAAVVASLASAGMAGMWLAAVAKVASAPLAAAPAWRSSAHAQPRRLVGHGARLPRPRTPADAAYEGRAERSRWPIWEAPALRLPVWQTALAGGLAGVATQLAAGNRAACTKALPTGAICCTCYVNLLNTASTDGDLDSVPVAARFACAGLASSVAVGTMTAITTLASRVPGASLVLSLTTAVKAAVPAMAIEMTAIDVAKRAMVEQGEKVPPGVLLLAGGVAGFVSQSILHPLGALASRPSAPAASEGGLARAAAEGCSKAMTKGRTRPLALMFRQLGPRYRRSVPGAAANSLTRVGLVTEFMDFSAAE